ncbi:MAG: hypothetical protein L0216_14800 [Planctomycetales bacterium]|nr:hypothetical protein [Planctomycetales bacterium]
MPSMVQIRNVPDDLHRKAKVRAAEAGLSLSAYLLRELRRLLASPTIEEISERARRRPRIAPSPSIAEIIRQERDSR